LSRARAVLRAAQRLVPRGRGGVCILCYHLVGAGSPLKIDLDEDTFRAHMVALKARFPVVGLGEALASLDRGELENDTAVALTFDDAYSNFQDRAWPVLAELGLPATLFVPVGFVDRSSPPPISTFDRPPLSWTDLRALCGSKLLTLGSHSWSHPDLRRVEGSALDRELRGSKERIEDQVGVPVEGFCYPRALWSPSLEREVVRFYSHAVAGGGLRIARARAPLHHLPRFPMRTDTPASLPELLTGRVWLEEWVANQARLRVRRGVA
jgi:peptidoglycan/xylan/chitin deacetylase (PgdA/CDA1 family)